VSTGFTAPQGKGWWRSPLRLGAWEWEEVLGWTPGLSETSIS